MHAGSPCAWPKCKQQPKCRQLPCQPTQPAHFCVEGSVCNDSIIGQDAHLHLQP